MDQLNSTTLLSQRKRGQHLRFEDRVIIQVLKRLGFSNRYIARQLNCSPSTVGYELKRGIPTYAGRGRRPLYNARRGMRVYLLHRQHCHRPRRIFPKSDFIQWMVRQFAIHGWSFDTCVGHARLYELFPAEEIPCTKTIYSMLWKNQLPITLFDLPEILKRKRRRESQRTARIYGTSIDERPAEVNERDIFGHWEGDTVIGKKGKGEPVVFTLVERRTGYYITIRIDGKDTKSIEAAMEQLHDEFSEHFSEVFKSITVDNGSEFAAFQTFEKYGTTVYFAHPYSAWERAVNERSNRQLRRYFPKSKSLSKYTADEIRLVSDLINTIPRKRLGYKTPEELFEDELDKIYDLKRK